MEAIKNLDEFTRAYLECALWAETDESTPEGGNPLDENYSIENFSAEAIALAVQDCKRFQKENAENLVSGNCGNLDGSDVEMGGHDFWLTRNGHGTGFWAGYWGEKGDRLTEASKQYGECNVYVGDNGTLHLSSG